ncbi:MAG: complex I subunit 5 family protein [Spirochaetaceae bacterium]
MVMQAQLVAALILAPLLGGAGALLSSLLPWRRLPGLVALASLLFGFAVSLITPLKVTSPEAEVLVVGGWAENVGITILYDGFASLIVALFYLVSSLILIHAMAEGERGPVFYGAFSVSLGGMVGVVLSADLFNLFVFFEVLSLSAALLIAYERSLPSMQAAFRYLLISTLSISLYLLGLFILYRNYGELSFAVLSHLITESDLNRADLRLAGALFFSAVATRIALVPFCGWLPEAHGQAPTAVSALLSGLMLKAGFVAFWHLIALFHGGSLGQLLMWFGGASAVFGAAAALVQNDGKRLLAFSSISQLGYITAAAGAGAFSASAYHLASHALYKSLLFLIVGSWVHRWGVRRIPALREALHGESAGWRERLHRAIFVLGVAAIIGLPPLSAFASKGVMSALMKYSSIYPVIQVAGVLTAAAMIKLALVVVPPGRRRLAYAGAARTDRLSGGVAGHGPRRSLLSAFGETLPLFFLLLFTLFLGAFPGETLRYLTAMRVPVAALPEQFEIYTLYRVVESLGVALIGLLLVKLLGTRWGKRFEAMMRNARLGVDGSMGFVVLGTATVVLSLLL